MLNLPIMETEDRRQCNFIVKNIQQKQDLLVLYYILALNQIWNDFRIQISFFNKKLKL